MSVNVQAWVELYAIRRLFQSPTPSQPCSNPIKSVLSTCWDSMTFREYLLKTSTRSRISFEAQHSLAASGPAPEPPFGFDSEKLRLEHELSHVRRIICTFPGCQYPLFCIFLGA